MTLPFRLIFISGGSRGLGLAIAKRFYKERFKVVICGRDAQKLAEAKLLMPELHTIVCDMSQKEQVQQMAKEVLETYGQIDVLVNNVATYMQSNLLNEADEVFEKQMLTNVFGPYYLTKILTKQMCQRHKGLVVNVCSTASEQIMPWAAAYSVSKTAVYALGKAFQQALEAEGVSWVNVLPGNILTDSWAGHDTTGVDFILPDDLAEEIWHIYQNHHKYEIRDVRVSPKRKG